MRTSAAAYANIESLRRVPETNIMSHASYISIKTFKQQNENLWVHTYIEP